MSIVFAGAGHAACQAAFSLRQLGYTGRLTLVDAEAELPYQRPPLSKAYLSGELDDDALRFKPLAFYEQQGIERVAGTVARIERDAACVVLGDGRRLAYEHLVLATGARNRSLDLPGATLAGVQGLRTLADARALRALHTQGLSAGACVVVLGAGFIGLEFAAVAAQHGRTVHVVEQAERPMARAVSPVVSRFIVDAHRRRGVHWHLGASVAELHGEQSALRAVRLTDGSTLPTGLLLVGIGVRPNTALAAEAGLAVSAEGIVVDEHLRTSDPCISAIGDVAAFPAQPGARPQRVESVQNALDQARCLAAGLAQGPAADAPTYRALPWFWSDQADLKLQIAGLPSTCDDFMALGPADPQALTVLGFAQGRLAAVETVNRPAEHLWARRGVGAGKVLTRTQAGADGFELKAWVSAA